MSKRTIKIIAILLVFAMLVPVIAILVNLGGDEGSLAASALIAAPLLDRLRV